MNKIALLIAFTVPSMLSGMEIVEVTEQPSPLVHSHSEPKIVTEAPVTNARRLLSPSSSAPNYSFSSFDDEEPPDKNPYRTYDMIMYHPFVRAAIIQINQHRKRDLTIDYATYFAWLSKHPEEKEKWEKAKAASFFDKLCALGIMRIWAPHGLDSKPMRIRIEFKRKYTIAELPKHNDAMVEFESQPE